MRTIEYSSIPLELLPAGPVVLWTYGDRFVGVYRSSATELMVNLSDQNSVPQPIADTRALEEALAFEALQRTLRSATDTTDELPQPILSVVPSPLPPNTTIHVDHNHLWLTNATGSYPIGTIPVHSYFGLEPRIFREDQTPDGRYVVLRMNNRLYLVDTINRRTAFLVEGNRATLMLR